MKIRLVSLLARIGGGAILLSTLLGFSQPLPSAAAVTLPEGNDFATSVLQAPWDMSEFSDISQYLNTSSYFSNVQNVQVQDGVFSASATANFTTNPVPGGPDPFFFTLWTGYNGAMLLGKVGANYPINSVTFHCFYAAAKVDEVYVAGDPGQMVMYWYKDEKLNGTGGVWGSFVPGIILYDELVGSHPAFTPYWKLHKIDLSTPPQVQLGTAWTAQSFWRGLRIDPTQHNTTFAFDWVRLTNCTPVNLALTGLTDGTKYYFFLVTSDNRRMYIESFTASGTTRNVDLQGVQPGTYTYQLATGLVAENLPSQANTVVQSGTVTINQTPIATIARPSATSGQDYATSAGNAWDFRDASDTPQTPNVPPQPGLQNFKSTSYSGGVLNMVSSSSTQAGGNDTQVYLNSPVGAATSQYRYLTFRMYTSWEAPWQDVPDGMIARWIWYIQGTTGRPGFECSLVSHDIPYDVGWQTYTIDLYDAFQGSVEQFASPPAPGNDCSGAPTNWAASGTVLRMRFDPDENISCSPLLGTNPNVPCSDFTMKLDWIRLTKVDSVQQGQPFPIQLGLNRPSAQVANIAYYYTTSPSQPTQNAAAEYIPPPLTGSQLLYLPVVTRNYALADFPSVANGVSFLWDTAGVAQGTYYICVTISDSLNSSSVCSDAPVVVQ